MPKCRVTRSWVEMMDIRITLLQFLHLSVLILYFYLFVPYSVWQNRTTTAPTTRPKTMSWNSISPKIRRWWAPTKKNGPQTISKKKSKERSPSTEPTIFRCFFLKAGSWNDFKDCKVGFGDFNALFPIFIYIYIHTHAHMFLHFLKRTLPLFLNMSTVY